MLVTGGAGFVASRCVADLLNAGHQVRATIRSLAGESALRAAIATQADARDRLEVVAANLMHDHGWAAAMAGVTDVLHVASPLGRDNPKDPDALIRPAVDGTVRILQAARDAGVRRVVLTSSGAAATPVPTGAVSIDERHWTDPDQPGLTAYRKSKVLAEKATWEFVDGDPSAPELVTVLPGAIFGPGLPGLRQSSSDIIGRMLAGAMPANPRIELGVVDVRDLADLHLRAITSPNAAGLRVLAISEILTMAQIGQLLRVGLGADGAKAPVRTMPDAIVRVASRFRPELGALVPMLGRHLSASSTNAREVLNWAPRPAAETVLDTGRFLLTNRS